MILTLTGAPRFAPLAAVLQEALVVSGRHFVFSTYSTPFVEKLRHTSGEAMLTTLASVRERFLDKSDALVVVNRHAYLDAPTETLIASAIERRRPIYRLETWKEGNGVGSTHTELLRDDKVRWGIPASYVSPRTTFFQVGEPGDWRDLYSLFGPGGVLRSTFILAIEAASFHGGTE